MPDQKAAEPKATPLPAKVTSATPELTPAGESSNPAVHQLLAELESHRTNGDMDEAQDIIGYLASLGYSAG